MKSLLLMSLFSTEYWFTDSIHNIFKFIFTFLELHFLSAFALLMSVQGYSRLGAAYQSLGEFEKAREAYETGLKHEPNNEAMKKGLVEAQSAACGISFHF